MDFFWTIAEPLLSLDGVEKSTMMGFPCLRAEGAFFASVHPESGDLIIKLPAERVQSMIDAEEGLPFSPAGRQFREWVRIENRDQELWARLLEEARSFVLT